MKKILLFLFVLSIHFLVVGQSIQIDSLGGIIEKLQKELEHVNNDIKESDSKIDSLGNVTKGLKTTKNDPYENYSWGGEELLTPCDIEGRENENGHLIRSMSGQRFKVLGLNAGKDSVIIRILNYSKKKKSRENYRKYNYFNYQKYFLVPDSLAKKQTTASKFLGRSLSIGILNLPFKYRIANKADFSNKFNINAAAGLKLGHYEDSRFKYIFLASAGISSIDLDSVSVRRAKDEIPTSSLSALSFALGAMVEYEKLQVGIFLGMDQINRATQEKFGWRYQSKPWLSMGIGYAIFSDEKEQEKKLGGQ